MNLAPPFAQVIPRCTRVYEVQWIKGEKGNPGNLIFPDNFSGKIETEVKVGIKPSLYILAS